MGIKIIGTGSYLPKKVVTNADLANIVDTSDEWITSRTGISERRMAAPEEAASDMAYEASVKALEAAGITAEDIDGIIFTTVTPDYAFPSSACVLQNKLGCRKVFAFDMQAACTGLIYALDVAHSMLIANPKYRRFLIASSEKLSDITDWTDRSTCVLFGDAASAVILERDDNAPDSFLACSLAADGTHWDKLIIPGSGSRMPITSEVLEQRLNFTKMSGQEVFKLAVSAMASACCEVAKEAGLEIDDIDWLVPHQANLRIMKMVANRISFPMEKAYVNVDRYGNTSSATIGICLDEMIRGGLLKRGQIVLLTAFGSGMTWGAIVLRY